MKGELGEHFSVERSGSAVKGGCAQTRPESHTGTEAVPLSCVLHFHTVNTQSQPRKEKKVERSREGGPGGLFVFKYLQVSVEEELARLYVDPEDQRINHASHVRGLKCF